VRGRPARVDHRDHRAARVDGPDWRRIHATRVAPPRLQPRGPGAAAERLAGDPSSRSHLSFHRRRKYRGTDTVRIGWIRAIRLFRAVFRRAPVVMAAARWLSIIAHPFVMVGVMVGA